MKFRSKFIVYYAANFVGKTLALDKNCLMNFAYVRVKIGCQDLSLIPNTRIGEIKKGFYEFQYTRELFEPSPPTGARTGAAENIPENGGDQGTPKRQRTGSGVFLPTRGGLEFVAGYFRSPSRDMGLEYFESRIARNESTLTDKYPPDHPIFTDPDGVKSKGWDSLKEAYLDKQDVRLDMRRFRPVLKKTIAHIRANKLQ
jgi:hypothetical protein